MSITWAERVANLRNVFGRDPTTEEILDAVQIHEITLAKMEEQRTSWARGMISRCDHGELDFEQCLECLKARKSL